MIRDDLYQFADELRGIASLGLHFSDQGYDRERYEQVLKISARMVARLENSTFDEIYTKYSDNLAHFSPILCVESVVFREGKILLIQRRDDHLWAIPGGLVEVGESLSQAAERELREEAGVYGRALRLLGVYDSRVWPARTRMQLCIAQFLIQTDEIPAVHSIDENETSPFLETLNVGFFDEHHLPELSVGHDLRVPMAFKMNRKEVGTFFD